MALHASPYTQTSKEMWKLEKCFGCVARSKLFLLRECCEKLVVLREVSVFGSRITPQM